MLKMLILHITWWPRWSGWVSLKDNWPHGIFVCEADPVDPGVVSQSIWVSGLLHISQTRAPICSIPGEYFQSARLPPHSPIENNTRKNRAHTPSLTPAADTRTQSHHQLFLGRVSLSLSTRHLGPPWVHPVQNTRDNLWNWYSLRATIEQSSSRPLLRILNSSQVYFHR